MTNEIYLCHDNEAEARAQGAALGMVFPDDGSIPSGNENYTLFSPIQAPWVTEPVTDADGNLLTPGMLESGYWSMLALNPNWEGYAATLAAINASGVRRYPVNTPLVLA